MRRVSLQLMCIFLFACLYEAVEKHPYEKIVFARFTLDWLTTGKEKSHDLVKKTSIIQK